MNVESTAFAGQRETTCHEEKDRTDSNLGFYSWFSVVVRAYLFAGFLFTGSRLQCDPFSEFTSKWRPINFRLSLHLRGWCSTRIFTSSRPAAYQLSNRSRPRGPYPFPMVLHLHRRFGTFVFFNLFLITVVIHLWLADLQTALQPQSLRGQLAFAVDSMSAFLSYLFLLFFLPQKLVSRSLYHLDLSCYTNCSIYHGFKHCYQMLIIQFIINHLLVGWLVGIYGISTLVGCLMPNPVYTHTHILNMYDLVWFLCLMAYQPL